jgi:hypothetical protein
LLGNEVEKRRILQGERLDGPKNLVEARRRRDDPLLGESDPLAPETGDVVLKPSEGLPPVRNVPCTSPDRDGPQAMVEPLKLRVARKPGDPFVREPPRFPEIPHPQSRADRIEDWLGRWEIEPLGRTALHAT